MCVQNQRVPPRDAQPRQLQVAPAGTCKPLQGLLGLGMLIHGCSCSWPCQGLNSGHCAGATTKILTALRAPEPRPGTIPVFPVLPARPSSASPQDQPSPLHWLLSQAPAASPYPGRMRDPALTLLPVFSKMKGKRADLGFDFPSPAFVGWGFPPGHRLLSTAPPAAEPEEGQIPVPRAGDGAGSVREPPSGTAIPGSRSSLWQFSCPWQAPSATHTEQSN